MIVLPPGFLSILLGGVFLSDLKLISLQKINELNLPSENNGNQTLIGQAVPMAITDYYTNLIEVQKTVPEYLKFLEAFGLSPLEGHGTITGWRHFTCESGHDYYYPEAQVNRYNPYHLWTSVRATASRSMSMLESLKEIRNIYDMVLTYPQEVSELAKTSPDIEAKCQACFKEFVERLSLLVYHYEAPGKRRPKLKACQLALSENLHLWKSEEPTMPHLHHHVLMLDVFLGQGKKHGRIYSKRFLTWNRERRAWEEGDLSKSIKVSWADCVNKHFKTNYPSLEVHNQIVSLDRDRARVLHKLKYKKRLPLFDLAEYYRDHEFNLVGLSPLFISKLLTYKNKTHSYGYWNRLLCSIVSVEIKKYECHCPLCGARSTDKGRESLPLDAIFVYIDRKGRLWEVI